MDSSHQKQHKVRIKQVNQVTDNTNDILRKDSFFN